MATKTVARPSTARAAGRAGRQGATRVTVAVLGTLVGLAGVEHGVGEILQGRVRPEGLFIMSWPDAAAMEILSGEPALTVIPDLLLTGPIIVALFAAAGGLLLVNVRPAKPHAAPAEPERTPAPTGR